MNKIIFVAAFIRRLYLIALKFKGFRHDQLTLGEPDLLVKIITERSRVCSPATIATLARAQAAKKFPPGKKV